jgi:hypothetical protein
MHRNFFVRKKQRESLTQVQGHAYAYVEQQQKHRSIWAVFNAFSFFNYSGRKVTKSLMLLRVKRAHFNALEKFSF